MANAREMIENILASYLDDGLNLPVASDIQKIEVQDSFVTLIQAPPFFLEVIRPLEKMLQFQKGW